MVSSGSMATNTNTALNWSGTKSQHGFHQGQDPQTSTWLQVAAKTMDSHMALDDNTGHGHQYGPQLQQDFGSKHGLRWQYRPYTSAWPLGGSSVLRHHRDLASLHWICTTSFLHPSQSSIANSFIAVALEAAMYYTVYCLPTQLSIKILIAASHWSVSHL